jgi:two-component system, cell cycle sensor histidine kinase and response regulator CckA
MTHSLNACSAGSSLKIKARGNPTRILLVDDDQDVRDIMREMLERSGFAVIPSQDGINALKVVEEYPGFIDLLLTDIRMPEMAGPELAEEAKLLRPLMRVLFVSADASAALASGELDQNALILPKPFSRGTLVEKVEYALQQ